jgi:integrase
MATIGKDSGGRKRILFCGTDGKRYTVRLGKSPQTTAQTFKVRIEALLAAKHANGSPDPETAAWVGDLDDKMYSKLVRVGLLRPRDPQPEQQSPTLAAFFDTYISSRADVKSSTATVYGHTRRCLIDYFGSTRPLREISPGDADQWRLWLVNHEKLADNTVRRRSGIAKQFFRAALRRKLIAENSFADLRATVRRNDTRYYFVTREEAAKVLDACPDVQWRLLFALSRYGGLRCPSEHLALRWVDVDWEHGRITVHASKTEHHDDGGIRVFPLFPEMRPYLEEVWERAEPGTEYVITRYRDSTTNLRTQLTKIIRRAGLKPWPKLWQNLRSTRETELAETFPIHVVCEWIGNTVAVAAKHYLQVTDEHFEQAATPRGTESGTRAAHFAAHHTSTRIHKDTQETAQALGNQGLVPNGENLYATLRNCQVGGTGLEPATSTV